MVRSVRMKEIDELISYTGKTGFEPSVLSDSETAHLVIKAHRVLSYRETEGVKMEARESPDGVELLLSIKEGWKIKKPIHLCFGLLHRRGTQRIKLKALLEKGSSAKFIAHCIFPNAEEVTHIMDADIRVGQDAMMMYSETHYHGVSSGAVVKPKAVVKAERNSRYYTEFNLRDGLVGDLELDYQVLAEEESIVELTAKVFGHKRDQIKIKEGITLKGMNARGLIKTRVALEGNAQAEVIGITEGMAEGARGHVDCMEVVKDNATARAIPVVRVTHPKAKVTHEAAIGSIDRKQLETLMAHGLSPEEAVDTIVKGILR